MPLVFATRYGSRPDQETIGSAAVVSLIPSFLTLPLIIKPVG
jgi:hypothetical protein